MAITADFHTHTHHSGDSDAPMDAMIESALKRRLTHLCFTDHQDFDFPTTHDAPGTFDLDVASYRAEYLTMKERYAGRINLSFGVELGLQPVCVEKNKAFVSEHPFDFVIASVHVAYGMDPYHAEYLEEMRKRLLGKHPADGAGGKNSDAADRISADDTDLFPPADVEREAMRCYLSAMYEDVQAFDDYDVLGHLDLCNRYWGKGRTAYRHDDHAEVIDAILTHLVKKDKGLDCNTNLLWKSGACEMNPSNAILKRFHGLGGRILTFGSDAHDPSRVAASFDRAAAIARDAGFTSYCTFKNRTPEFHKL